MDTTSILAFICYALVIPGWLAFGIIYLLRNQFMPYHQQALGLPWKELDGRLQALLLGLMRAVAGPTLAAGFSMLIILLIPFRLGELWAEIALPVIGLLTGVPALYATILIRRRTQANTPVKLLATMIGLILLGIIFTLL